MPALSQAIEEPDFLVLRHFDGVDWRQCVPDWVAEVVLDSTAEDAGKQAFPILAGYLLSKCCLATLLNPLGGPSPDARARKGPCAWRGPSGLHARWRRQRRLGALFGKNKGEEKLAMTALAAANVPTEGEPVLARYNAPFTPWFLRRNEIWLALR